MYAISVAYIPIRAMYRISVARHLIEGGGCGAAEAVRRVGFI